MSQLLPTFRPMLWLPSNVALHSHKYVLVHSHLSAPRGNRFCKSRNMAQGAQLENVVHVITETDEFFMHGRPCELSANAFVPPRRPADKDRNAFNTTRQERYSGNEFDRLFNQPQGYNQYLHRCDREHAKSRGLQVNQEEMTKDVPTLASTVYGQKIHMHVDHPDRKHVRVAKVKTEFFRRNDINIRKNVIGFQ